MIAVDDITAELKRIIEYLNVLTAGTVQVLGLELQLAKDGTTQILIPHLWGESVDTKGSKTSTTKWNAATFGAAVDALAEPERSIVKTLMEHGQQHGSHPWWGVGQVPGMSWYYKVAGTPLSLFQIYLRPSGVVVAASIGGLASAAIGGPTLALKMLAGLKAIPLIAPHVAHVDETSLNRYPSVPVRGVLDQPGVLAQFLSVIDDVRQAAATP